MTWPWPKIHFSDFHLNETVSLYLRKSVKHFKYHSIWYQNGEKLSGLHHALRIRAAEATQQEAEPVPDFVPGTIHL